MSDMFIGAGVELVLCIGYMHIIPSSFTRTWSGRLLNAHPSLLPSFKGLMDLEVYAQVLAARDADARDARLALPTTATQVDGAAGAPVTGCTVHFVTDDVDGGPIVAQLATALTAADTAESVLADLRPRVQKMEGDAFIAAILKFKRGELAALAAPSTLPAYRGIVGEDGVLAAPPSPDSKGGVSFGGSVSFGKRPKIKRRQTGPASAPRAISMTSAANAGAPPRHGAMSAGSAEEETAVRGIKFAADVSFAPPARIERTLTGYGDDLGTEAAQAVAMLTCVQRGARSGGARCAGQGGGRSRALAANEAELVRVITMEEKSFSGPVTKFIERLVVAHDLEGAKDALGGVDACLRGDYFAAARGADAGGAEAGAEGKDGFVVQFMLAARKLIIEASCRIHQKLDLAQLARKLQMEPAEAEQWMVKIIRSSEARSDESASRGAGNESLKELAMNQMKGAKIDSLKSHILMSVDAPSVYAQLVQKTQGLQLRSENLCRYLTDPAGVQPRVS